METANRDITPSEPYLAAYPQLDFFIGNRPVAEAFAKAEQEAVRWKTRHNWAGRISLGCILVVMWTLAYQLTVGVRHPPPEWLATTTAALGGAGLIAQLVLIFGRLKERWLLARFAAERLRCLKFQAFAILAEEADTRRAAQRAEAFTTEGIANLMQELEGGRAALVQFSPRSVLRGERRPHGRFAEQAEAVYERLRLDVQVQHFEAQAHRAREADRLPATLAEFTFVLGAIIACVDVVLASLYGPALEKHLDWLLGWLRFATWSLFALSSVVAIYQRGAARKTDAERYARYAREVVQICSRCPTGTASGFADVVRDMEMVALQELDDFCRDSELVSYVF